MGMPLYLRLSSPVQKRKSSVDVLIAPPCTKQLEPCLYVCFLALFFFFFFFTFSLTVWLHLLLRTK
jgi:hypothetical protein